MRFFVDGMPLASFLALAIMVLLSGCLAAKTKKCCPVSGEGGFPFVNEAMDPSSYLQEMKKWQTVLQETPDSKTKAEAHLHIAGLYFAKNNPQKNFSTGYVELTRATAACPDLQKNTAFTGWLELLAMVETESKKAQKDIVDLEKQLTRAQHQIATQHREIVKLRETLEKLKSLEMSVERKRRSFQ